MAFRLVWSAILLPGVFLLLQYGVTIREAPASRVRRTVRGVLSARPAVAVRLKIAGIADIARHGRDRNGEAGRHFPH